MDSTKQFNALLQVLSGEQQVIQRTDQKAFTLLSILGFHGFFYRPFSKNSNQLFYFYINDDLFYFSNGYNLLFSTCHRS